MKQFLLICLLACLSISVNAQFEYTTVQNGAYTADATWGGAGLKPPVSGSTCNCKIIVNHDLSINSLTLTNANFVLPSATSKLSLNNNSTLRLDGTSSFDLQNTGATIQLNHNQYQIILKNTVIFTRNSASVNVSPPSTGIVRGLASASSARTSPLFINSVLPVKLSEFKLNGKDSKVVLSWTTDLEINSDRFDIERSDDSKSWSRLGSVNAAGNISVAQHYSFTDNAPLNGENYYRLKMIDIDAKFEYSPIKSVNINATNLALNASPNPANSVLNIAVTQSLQKDYQLKLINRTGQVLYNRKLAAAAGRISLQVSNFPEGSYFVEVTDALGNRVVKNVLIVRR